MPFQKNPDSVFWMERFKYSSMTLCFCVAKLCIIFEYYLIFWYKSYKHIYKTLINSRVHSTFFRLACVTPVCAHQRWHRCTALSSRPGWSSCDLRAVTTAAQDARGQTHSAPPQGAGQGGPGRTPRGGDSMTLSCYSPALASARRGSASTTRWQWHRSSADGCRHRATGTRGCRSTSA